MLVSRNRNLLNGILVFLTLVTVLRESSGLHDRQNDDENHQVNSFGYRSIDKYAKDKKYRGLNFKKYRTSKSHVEAGNHRDEDYISRDGYGKQTEESERKRIRRNADTSATERSVINNFPAKVEVAIGKKNRKKLKLAESQVQRKGLKNKGISCGQETSKCNSENKPPLSKKKIRRSPVVPVKIDFSRVNESPFDRWKREAALHGERSIRTNETEYHAQRKAVMEWYYNRQREIAEKYAKQATSTPTNLFPRVSKPGSDSSSLSMKITDRNLRQTESALRNVVTNGPNSAVGSSTTPTTAPPEKIKSTTRRTDFLTNLRPDVENEATEKNVNVARDASNFYPVGYVPHSPLSGTFPPKRRIKPESNWNKEKRANRGNSYDVTTERDDLGDGDQRWGECEGKLVYQHNLRLGLKGPSNLDTVFEVIIQGHVCISCVEALRYNQTRATVSLDSGGRGHEFAKLRLKGFENEGFWYIVKIHGVKKTKDDCKDVID